jgi:hypothetical protein
MKKSYRYRGFVIIVEAQSLTTDPDVLIQGVTPGYVAVVEIGMANRPEVVVSTFEVGAPPGKRFRREAEVFASGYHAATSIIEKALGASTNTMRSGKVRTRSRLALLAT